MADNDADFAALLARYSGLGRADRKAVLASFTPEERIAFENAIAADEKIATEEEERRRQSDRQFLGYSPWLAKIVEAAVKEDNSKLAHEAAKAVVIEHKTLIASRGSEARGGWRGVLDRLSDLLAPAGVTGADTK